MKAQKTELERKPQPTWQIMTALLKVKLVEMWLIKATLVAEMRNVLLETGPTVILVVKWQRTWLSCTHNLVFCGRQNL